MVNEKKLIQDALDYHHLGDCPGKLGVTSTKPLNSRRDLSLAYSPGVAYPCLEIKKNKKDAYKYTSKGNSVAVISNGTAVLGLGNLGSLASKPVMEGKAILFKHFADIDAVDLQIDTEDKYEFIKCVKLIGNTWGAINLEDIKSPECFYIEQELNKLLDIPVFHDDQHGTAIIVAAGILNALEITKRDITNVKIVLNGPGAAGLACVNLLKKIGVQNENFILCDLEGVLYKGRTKNMNEWKVQHVVDTKARTLSDAMVDADVFLGLSAPNIVTPKMLETMAKNPIIFAMANPDPEIRPELALKTRPDAIIATGRSDYNNQVNNVMGFPYIIRGALDVRATEINDTMKIAAAQSIATLARCTVPDEVLSIYSTNKLEYGPNYIIPTPFDPRLITSVPIAVAKAAIETGVAKNIITDWEEYENKLLQRLNPASRVFQDLYTQVKASPKRLIFSDGEEEQAIKAALMWRDNGYGRPILVGRVDKIKEKMDQLNVMDHTNIEIINAALSKNNEKYIDYMYKKLQRKGYLRRDCIHAVKTKRNIFATCMLACNDGDILVAGLTRNYTSSLKEVQSIIDKKKNSVLFGFHALISNSNIIFVADTAINETHTSEHLSLIAIKMAEKVQLLGYTPRVAFASYSTYGSRSNENTKLIQNVLAIMDKKNLDFEYDGELSPDIALDAEILKSRYSFSRLTDAANILIFPTLQSSSPPIKLMKKLGNTAVIGPVIIGLEKSVQIVPMDSKVEDIMQITSLSLALI